MPGVVGNVHFVENQMDAAAMQGAQDRPVGSGVAVSPGGGDRQSKERNFQEVTEGNVLTFRWRWRE